MEDWQDELPELATICTVQVLPTVFHHIVAYGQSHSYRSNIYQARCRRQVGQRDNLYERKQDSAHNILMLRPISY